MMSTPGPVISTRWRRRTSLPLVVWLGSVEVAGRHRPVVFEVEGGIIRVAEGWARGADIDKGARWDPAELGPVVADLLAKSRQPLPCSAPECSFAEPHEREVVGAPRRRS